MFGLTGALILASCSHVNQDIGEPVGPTAAQMQAAKHETHVPRREIVDRSEMPRVTNFIQNNSMSNQTQIQSNTRVTTRYLNVFPY
jgi:hypothetical protein